MIHRFKIPLFAFAIAAIVFLIGQYFRGVWFSSFPFNTCTYAHDETGVFCNSPYSLSVGFPLIIAGEFLAGAALILLFANERGRRAWLRFSIFYIPIATALVLWAYPFQLPLGQTIQLSSGVNFAGRLYLLITAIIVLYTRYKVWRAAKVRPASDEQRHD